MKKIIKEWLGISEIEGKISDISRRLDELCGSVTSQVNEFGDYKNQSDAELDSMKGAIESMLIIIEEKKKQDLIDSDRERANSIVRRLKNNRTRIINARSSRI